MPLTASELAVVSRLLDDALALDAADRAHWLETLPAEHIGLMPALREMLAHVEIGPEKLFDRLPRLPENTAYEPTEINSLEAGDRVGPYELIRELGVGGM